MFLASFSEIDVSQSVGRSPPSPNGARLLEQGTDYTRLSPKSQIRSGQGMGLTRADRVITPCVHRSLTRATHSTVPPARALAVLRQTIAQLTH